MPTVPRVIPVAAPANLHDEVASRLAGAEQRYTPARRAIVEALATAGRPVTVPEIVDGAAEVPLSSAYRNIGVLIDVGVVRRVAGHDDHGRVELAEDLAGHHHHLVCEVCGRVDDVRPSPRLERALAEAARAAADELGYEVTEHRFDLHGTCPECR